jgi:endonuclease I
MTKRLFILSQILVFSLLSTWAQGPNNSEDYYQAASGKKGQDLKTALFNIIKLSSPAPISYDGLIESYKETDTRSDWKVRDWYSNATNFTHVTDKAGNYSKEGDVYNREHLIPQSWFNKAAPMRSDIVHVVPTDGYVNNRRGDLPLAEVGSATYTSINGYSKLGSCKTTGYSGKVFEPNDEVKGDIARIYFYMATCYQDKITGWGGEVITGTAYQPYAEWYFNMLMRWSKLDPIDEVEIARNNAVKKEQGNRNPFGD